MKCPICGCKIKENFMCPYCKVTADQVKNASNKKAKECIKNKNTKNVYNSTTLPKDVNNTRLLLTAIFGGLVGAHRFRVGKIATGVIYLSTLLFAILGYVLSEVLLKGNTVMGYLADLSYLIEAIVLVCWITDIVKILFKSFSIPIVLGDVKDKEKL